MLGCDRLFYHPTRREYDRPERLNLTYESVSFATGGGQLLHGWFFPALGQANGTILHIHGNAGNVTAHFHQIRWLPEAGWNVLCFDYRGYGKSEGRVTRAGTIADAHAALDYLLGRPDVAKERVVGFGQSLGGAIGIVLAAERTELRGLAIDGAFTHYRDIARWHIRQNPLLFLAAWWLPSLLMEDGYDAIDYVAKVSPRPLLILHGTADSIVPVQMAEQLYAAAQQPKELWLVEEADHYQAMDELGDSTHPRLAAFFQACVDANAATMQTVPG